MGIGHSTGLDWNAVLEMLALPETSKLAFHNIVTDMIAHTHTHLEWLTITPQLDTLDELCQ